MPLLKRTGQPFFADPNSPNKISCSGEYCYPLAQGDIPYQQWYQTPCQANEVCDPTFTDFSLGAELVTNGDFATNANGWFANLLEIGANTCPTDVEGWCWDSGFVTHEPGSEHPLYQEALGLVAGTVYQITYTVASMTAGTIMARLGENAGAGNGSINSSNGTYTETVFYNDNEDFIAFDASSDFDGSLTDISVMSYTVTCWQGDEWTFDSESACRPDSDGTPGNLANITTDYIVSGEYYLISVDITVTAGSIQVYIDDGAGVETNLQTAVTESGSYEYYVTASQAGVIGFKPSADFVGCVSNPNVQTLKQNYQFEIEDADGNTWDISDQVQYINETVNITTDVFAINELPYGCYTINAYDSCLIEGVELATNGNFAAGSTGWTLNNGAGQYNFASGYVELIFEPQDTPTIVTNGDFATGDFTGWTAGANWAVVGNAAVHTPGSTATLSQTVTTETPASVPNVLFYWIQFTMSGRTAGSVTVTLSDKTSVAFSTNTTITTPLVPTIGGAPVTFSINPSSTFDGTIDDINVRASHNPWSAFPILLNDANAGFTAGDNFRVSFDITNTVGNALIAADGGLSGSTTASVWNSGNGTYSQVTTGYVPGAQRVVLVARFVVNNIYYPGRIRIDNVTAVRIEPFDATYTSECLNYQLAHTNTKLITATCDQDSFGFEFANSGFRLQQRVECRSLNPVYNRDVNVAKSGTGNAAVKYASVEKYWQFVTGYLSESAHDALAIQISCDHFAIGDSEANDTEYIAETEDYTPNWNTAGSYDLAPVTINLRVKEGGQVFNRHT